jgi:hypothetical protein|tara:strand:- start:490 stop:633 length:144 start_codon:yes stop_codon:yes gene_type:complete
MPIKAPVAKLYTPKEVIVLISVVVTELSKTASYSLSINPCSKLSSEI